MPGSGTTYGELMTTGLVLTIAVLALGACLLSGMRIALALTLSGFVGFLLLDGFDVGMSVLGTLPINTTSKFTLLVIPMFILLGIAAQKANLATAAYQLLGWLMRGIPPALALGPEARSSLALCLSSTAAPSCSG